MPSHVGLRPVSDHDALRSLFDGGKATFSRHLAEQSPNLLGEERHDRMEQTQDRVEHVCHDTLRPSSLAGVFETALCHLCIDAAEFFPNEVIQLARNLGILVVLESSRHVVGNGRESTQNPAILKREIRVGDRCCRVALEVH